MAKLYSFRLNKYCIYCAILLRESTYSDTYMFDLRGILAGKTTNPSTILAWPDPARIQVFDLTHPFLDLFSARSSSLKTAHGWVGGVHISAYFSRLYYLCKGYKLEDFWVKAEFIQSTVRCLPYSGKFSLCANFSRFSRIDQSDLLPRKNELRKLMSPLCSYWLVPVWTRRFSTVCPL